jgi:protein CpxP
MKNVFLALLMFVGITALAQEKEMKKPNGDKYASLTSEQKVELQVKRMTKDLDLNEKQINEMKVLVAKEVEKRENKKAEMEALRAQKRKEMKHDSVAKSQEMKKILSPEQFAKWEKIHEERREKMKEKMSQKKRSKDLMEIPEEK